MTETVDSWGLAGPETAQHRLPGHLVPAGGSTGLSAVFPPDLVDALTDPLPTPWVSRDWATAFIAAAVLAELRGRRYWVRRDGCGRWVARGEPGGDWRRRLRADWCPHAGHPPLTWRPAPAGASVDLQWCARCTVGWELRPAGVLVFAWEWVPQPRGLLVEYPADGELVDDATLAGWATDARARFERRYPS